MDKIHERIYLQIDGEGFDDTQYLGDITWCQDAINENDVEYIRADVVQEQIASLESERDKQAKVIEIVGRQLRRLTWVELSETSIYCACCHEHKKDGHAIDCELAQALSELQEDK